MGLATGAGIASGTSSSGEMAPASSGTGAETCVPSDAKAAIGSDCGVFVSSSTGDDANVGSQAKPFKSIERALGSANGRPVYACAEDFSEALTPAVVENRLRGSEVGVVALGALDDALADEVRAAVHRQLLAVAARSYVDEDALHAMLVESGVADRKSVV